MFSSAETAARSALERFVRSSADPRPALDAALADDPDYVPAHLLRAGMAIAAKDRAAFVALDESLAALARLAPALNERERLHCDAAATWRAGEHARAAAAYAGIVRRWPHDLLAIRLAQSCLFMLGQADAMLAVTVGALPHGREGTPGHDALLALHAFALDESGDCVRAEGAARRALAIEPGNPCAIHAVAHALDGRAAGRPGLAWLESRAGDWAGDGAMTSHNWWHVALAHLALGRPERSLAVYDAALAPALERIGADAMDAAALLWRLELGGVEVGTRWRAVAATFGLRPQPSLWPLVDVHAGIAFAAAGRARELDRLCGKLELGHDAARAVAAAVVRALQAFAASDYAAAAAILAPAAAESWRLGGSLAQREIVALTLEAAQRRSTRIARAA